jgi:BASS family bile acid:Na+ symporter
MAVFVLAGLVVGHLIGGPAASDRSVLALATACRHPAVAMGVAHLAFPSERATAAAVLLYTIVSLVLTAPYVAWRRKALVSEAPLGATPAAR